MGSRSVQVAAGVGIVLAAILVVVSFGTSDESKGDTVSAGPVVVDVVDQAPTSEPSSEAVDQTEAAAVPEAPATDSVAPTEIPTIPAEDGSSQSPEPDAFVTPDFGVNKPFGNGASIPKLGPVPEITDISAWLNTDGSSFEEVRGEVTVIQFWTFGCYNCKNTIPNLQALYADQHENGLEIIGIHAHEFDREQVPENVEAAVIDLGVTWPVALDTNKTNFRAWQGSRRFWPRTYVIDSEGEIRFNHIGEGQYDELNRIVEALLAESA